MLFVPDPGSPASSSDWLIGGGEMGHRIRAFDWSRHPLGSPEHWPHSLRTAVRLVLNSRYPMFVWWGPSLFNFYNDAYSVILGKRHPRALGAHAREVWGEIWDVLGPEVDRVMSGGAASWNHEQLLVMERNGYTEETYFSWSYSPVFDDTGGVGGIFCACTDDTERVIGKRRLQLLRDLAQLASDDRRAEEACAHVGQSLQGHQLDVPFALIYLRDETDAELRLVTAMGLDPRNHGIPASIRPDGAGPDEFHLREADAGRSARIENLDRLRIRGGPWPEWVHTAMALPLAHRGKEQSAGVIVLGASPRRAFDEPYQLFLQMVADAVSNAMANARAYEQERKRAEDLAELDRARTLFFSNVSHEFRTPLTLMLGPLEEELETTADRPASRNRISMAHRNSLRLLRLVNTLLDFSRLEADAHRGAYEATDLARFTTDIASVFRSAIEKARLHFQVDCAALSEPAYVDREMWEKIVSNLLSNAFKFTFDGTIEVILRQNGRLVELSVRDTGIGIPQHELPHLFKRFHRVSGARGRTFEGTGIGLALVQELVRLHGGQVSVKSREGEGSTFSVTLPLGCDHLPAEQIRQGPEASTDPANATVRLSDPLQWLQEVPAADEVEAEEIPPFDRPRTTRADEKAANARVLLVDDNPDMRAYVQRLLADRYEVSMASDGEAALEQCRSQQPDLVLTDVMMPLLDGFGLVGELRKDVRTRDIPIIVVSARAGEEARLAGLRSGADDYLTKPFSARELVARIEAHLQLARLRRTSAEQIRQSEERYRALIQSLPVALYFCDAEGRVQIFNQAAVKLWGRTPESGRELWCGAHQIYDPDGRPVPHASSSTAIALTEKRPVNDVEAIVERPDGQRRHVLSNARPLLDASGKVIGALNAVIDITERKLVEESLRKHNERLQLLSEALAGLLTTRNPQEASRTLLPKMARHLGSDTFFNFHVGPEDGMLTLNAYGGVPEDTARSLRTLRFGEQISGAVAERQRAIYVEDVQRSTDPKMALIRDLGLQAYACHPCMIGDRLLGTLSFATRARPRFDPDEIEFMRVITHYFSLAIDNAALYQAIERELGERQREESRLRRQKDVLEEIVRGAPLEDVLEMLTSSIEAAVDRKLIATILLMEPDGVHLRPLAGRSCPAEWRKRIDPLKISDEAGSCAAAAFSGQRVVVEDIASDPRWKTMRDAALVFGLRACWSAPILSSQNKVLGAFAVYYHEPGAPTPHELELVDILTRTAAIAIERKGAERALREAQEKLQRHAHELERLVAERTAKLQDTVGELEAFSYSIAHDMRAPLRSMQGYAGILVEECSSQLTPEGRMYLDRIAGAADRMDRLILDALNFSRMARAELLLEPVDVDPLVRGIIDTYPNLQPRVADIEIRGRLPVVLGNQAALTQCFSNLLGNAVKFVAPGTRPEVTIWAEEEPGQRTRIYIRDTGIGISPESHQQIFEIFQRLSNQYEGTGIGLAIVKKSVERMNGKVGLTSELNQGSTFWVELDRLLKPASTVDHPAATTPLVEPD